MGCRSGTSTRSAEERDVDRALLLISEGELGKASKGLADAGDPRIQAQLRSKHPARKGELPGSLDTLGAFVRVHVSLEDTIRGLSNHAGTGASGYRNEYLKALVSDFADARARTVLPLLNEFATAYWANCDAGRCGRCAADWSRRMPSQSHPLRSRGPAQAPAARTPVAPASGNRCFSWPEHPDLRRATPA